MQIAALLPRLDMARMTRRDRICTEEKRRESADNWNRRLLSSARRRQIAAAAWTDLGITFGVHVKGGKENILYSIFFCGAAHTELSTRCQSPIPRSPSSSFSSSSDRQMEEDEEEEEEEEEEDGGCFVPIRPWSKVTGKEGREEKFSCDGKHAKHFIFFPFPLLQFSPAAAEERKKQ